MTCALGWVFLSVTELINIKSFSTYSPPSLPPPAPYFFFKAPQPRVCLSRCEC